MQPQQPPARPVPRLSSAALPWAGVVGKKDATGQLLILFSMNNYQDNQDFLQRMNLLLDNELTPDMERKLFEEIKTNKSYRELMSQEKSFREFVRSRIHRKKVSPSLVQSIREKIHSSR